MPVHPTQYRLYGAAPRWCRNSSGQVIVCPPWCDFKCYACTSAATSPGSMDITISGLSVRDCWVGWGHTVLTASGWKTAGHTLSGVPLNGTHQLFQQPGVGAVPTCWFQRNLSLDPPGQLHWFALNADASGQPIASCAGSLDVTDLCCLTLDVQYLAPWSNPWQGDMPAGIYVGAIIRAASFYDPIVWQPLAILPLDLPFDGMVTRTLDVFGPGPFGQGDILWDKFGIDYPILYGGTITLNPLAGTRVAQYCDFTPCGGSSGPPPLTPCQTCGDCAVYYLASVELAADGKAGLALDFCLTRDGQTSCSWTAQFLPTKTRGGQWFDRRLTARITCESDPNGYVYLLTIGDPVGVDQSGWGARWIWRARAGSNICPPMFGWTLIETPAGLGHPQGLVRRVVPNSACPVPPPHVAPRNCDDCTDLPTTFVLDVAITGVGSGTGQIAILNACNYRGNTIPGFQSVVTIYCSGADWVCEVSIPGDILMGTQPNVGPNIPWHFNVLSAIHSGTVHLT